METCRSMSAYKNDDMSCTGIVELEMGRVGWEYGTRWYTSHVLSLPPVVRMVHAESEAHVLLYTCETRCIIRQII